MSWKLLADVFLAGPKRKRELNVETNSAYGKWVLRVEKELKVFFSRADRLDLAEPSDRQKLYNLVDKLKSRLEELREDSDAHQAPKDALIELGEFIEFLDGLSAPTARSSVTHLGNNPWKEAELRKRKKDRMQNEIERIAEDRGGIAKRILSLRETFEGEI